MDGLAPLQRRIPTSAGTSTFVGSYSLDDSKLDVSKAFGLLRAAQNGRPWNHFSKLMSSAAHEKKPMAAE
jgi:hypothetical protein